MTVRTGDVRYAGTDANVFIVIHGKKGKTKKLFMDDSRNNFERGATETFEVVIDKDILLKKLKKKNTF